jgi:hypothetical protein
LKGMHHTLYFSFRRRINEGAPGVNCTNTDSGSPSHVFIYRKNYSLLEN